MARLAKTLIVSPAQGQSAIGFMVQVRGCPQIYAATSEAVPQVKHDEFLELARATSRNAGGLRPLAAHIRRLYSAIRTLRSEDNSFYYIAEVVQESRADKTDAGMFMTRVKTYFHRDRAAVGDPLIKRGMTPASAHSGESRGAADVVASTAMHIVAVPHADRSPLAPASPRPEGPDEHNSARAPTDGVTAPLDIPRVPLSRHQQLSLTEAIHARPGRRRLAEDD